MREVILKFDQATDRDVAFDAASGERINGWVEVDGYGMGNDGRVMAKVKLLSVAEDGSRVEEDALGRWFEPDMGRPSPAKRASEGREVGEGQPEKHTGWSASVERLTRTIEGLDALLSADRRAFNQAISQLNEETSALRRRIFAMATDRQALVARIEDDEAERDALAERIADLEQWRKAITSPVSWVPIEQIRPLPDCVLGPDGPESPSGKYSAKPATPMGAVPSANHSYPSAAMCSDPILTGLIHKMATCGREVWRELQIHQCAHAAPELSAIEALFKAFNLPLPK